MRDVHDTSSIHDSLSQCQCLLTIKEVCTSSRKPFSRAQLQRSEITTAAMKLSTFALFSLAVRAAYIPETNDIVEAVGYISDCALDCWGGCAEAAKCPANNWPCLNRNSHAFNTQMQKCASEECFPGKLLASTHQWTWLTHAVGRRPNCHWSVWRPLLYHEIKRQGQAGLGTSRKAPGRAWSPYHACHPRTTLWYRRQGWCWGVFSFFRLFCI